MCACEGSVSAPQWKRRRRRRFLEEPFPSDWRPLLERVRLYRLLGDADRATVEDNLRIIVEEKNWEGCGGLTITDEMQVVIAAQAALMILNIPHDYFCGVQSILVYPTTFLVTGRRRSAGGIVDGAAQPVLGLASMQGPVILAWD